MTTINDGKGNIITVTEKPDGVKLVELRGPYGIGELRLDANSAREIGQALQPQPQDANLGIASTRELLVELECRYRIGLQGVPTPAEEAAASKLRALLDSSTSEQLDYRTVDHG